MLGGPVVFHRHGAGWSLGTPVPWGPRCRTAPGATRRCNNYTPTEYARVILPQPPHSGVETFNYNSLPPLT